MNIKELIKELQRQLQENGNQEVYYLNNKNHVLRINSVTNPRERLQNAYNHVHQLLKTIPLPRDFRQLFRENYVEEYIQQAIQQAANKYKVNPEILEEAISKHKYPTAPTYLA